MRNPHRNVGDTKYCAGCEQHLDRDLFYRKPARCGPKGRSALCKKCHCAEARVREKSDPLRRARYQRKASLKMRYGITLDDYDEMLEGQDYSCAICSTTHPGGRGGFKVDHCHETGVVRGLLCQLCNLGIGYFRDDTELMVRAMVYVSKGGVEC